MTRIYSSTFILLKSKPKKINILVKFITFAILFNLGYLAIEQAAMAIICKLNKSMPLEPVSSVQKTFSENYQIRYVIN